MMEKGILLRLRFAFEFTRRGKERKSGVLPKEMLRVAYRGRVFQTGFTRPTY
jgi:hypothetical protein